MLNRNFSISIFVLGVTLVTRTCVPPNFCMATNEFCVIIVDGSEVDGTLDSDELFA
jgi:hypothetical protein